MNVVRFLFSEFDAGQVRCWTLYYFTKWYSKFLLLSGSDYITFVLFRLDQFSVRLYSSHLTMVESSVWLCIIGGHNFNWVWRITLMLVEFCVVLFFNFTQTVANYILVSKFKLCYRIEYCLVFLGYSARLTLCNIWLWSSHIHFVHLKFGVFLPNLVHDHWYLYFSLCRLVWYLCMFIGQSM